LYSIRSVQSHFRTIRINWRLPQVSHSRLLPSATGDIYNLAGMSKNETVERQPNAAA
jgi:hypothetical protein